MGTSATPREFVGKIDDAGKRIESNAKRAAVAVGEVVQSAAVAGAARVLGPDRVFSGTKRAKRRKPKPVGARLRLKGDGAAVSAEGPMHWLEEGVQPHPIVPKANKRIKGLAGLSLDGAQGPVLPLSAAIAGARRKPQNLMVWDGGKAAAYYVSSGGGSPAHETWSTAVAAGERASLPIMARNAAADLRDVFRG